MARIETRVSDRRILKLIRTLLKAGVMGSGLVSPVDEGTPKGGPLPPQLSHIVLDEFDRELERRGLRFARYADDCNGYVRSRIGYFGQCQTPSVLQGLKESTKRTAWRPTSHCPMPTSTRSGFRD